MTCQLTTCNHQLAEHSSQGARACSICGCPGFIFSVHEHATSLLQQVKAIVKPDAQFRDERVPAVLATITPGQQFGNVVAPKPSPLTEQQELGISQDMMFGEITPMELPPLPRLDGTGPNAPWHLGLALLGCVDWGGKFEIRIRRSNADNSEESILVATASDDAGLRTALMRWAALV